VSPEDITAIEQRVSWRLGLVVHGSDGRVRCRQHKQRGVHDGPNGPRGQRLTQRKTRHSHT
jgi:hypothetical protein